ncbi:hypothetical protein F5Y08DRAFT_349542 [Xylaria arbuscula]|nr:hypothetical protein F5Y08DRAFT_349542 [Xylaria arbuscula]
MEPISATAAISQLSDIIRWTSNVYDWICDLREASKDLREAKDEINNHLSLLERVRCFMRSDGQLAPHLAFLAERGGPLERANGAISDLLRLVGGDASNDNPLDSIRMVVANFKKITLNEALWTTKKREITRARQRLEAQRSIITGALMPALGKQAIDRFWPPNEEMKDIHSNRKQQQEPETCNWVMREEAFIRSLRSFSSHRDHCRFICIHGIPGAGKTVLASSIIEKVADDCNSHGYAFYYCLYSRKRDETVPFLKWVLRQLCTQAKSLVPRKLLAAYEAEGTLSIEDLLDCLEEVSLSYRNGVYIVVDAVDESHPRENLIQVLPRIGTEERFINISLLLTSREENEVMGTIHELGAACSLISMSNKNVREDLKRYVHEQLTKIARFNRWQNDRFLGEVESTLTDKANGMFRWAVCQLDVLKRKRDPESILDALLELPHDIFDTYERILVEIPQEDRNFAKTALALICNNTTDSAETLVAACLYCVPFGDISLYDICGSLVSVTKLNRPPFTILNREREVCGPFHRCTLAHYTVKEYLFSPQIATGAAKFFALSDNLVENIDLKVIFTGLSQFPRPSQAQRKPPMTRYEEFCLRMTEKALSPNGSKSRRPDIIHNGDLIDVVLKSLTPTSPHFMYLKKITPVALMRAKFPNWLSVCDWDNNPPDHSPTGLLVNLAILKWKDLAKRYLESLAFQSLGKDDKKKTWTEPFQLKNAPEETLLGYCLREEHLNFLRILVRHGRASFENEPEALYTAMHVLQHKSRALDDLEFLLRSGADPNPKPDNDSEERFAFSPLQLAVYMLEYDWVELLLEEGADVNVTRGGTIVPAVTLWDDFLVQERSCLEICSDPQPAWLAQPGADESSIRNSIRALLKRHGAEEFHEDDVEMHDNSGLSNDVAPVRIDLTHEL